MEGDWITARLTKPLPQNVVGPRTRWIVRLEHYGKGSSKADLVANCLTNGKSVILLSGRAAYVEGTARNGFRVRLSSIQCKIVSALVASGAAEFVNQGRDPFNERDS
jgi:hypothetical protein